MDPENLRALEQRLGRLHARQRLGIETDHELRIFGGGRNFFHPENWYSLHSIMRKALKLSGLYWPGRRNASRIRVRHNTIRSSSVPARFDGYTILQLSDLHVDISRAAMRRLASVIEPLAFDLCVMTGDYRGQTFGPFDATLRGLAALRPTLREPVYAVLGNHDTIRMVPDLEAMGIRVLLNECVTLSRDGQHLHLGGIDDAHYYRVDNIEKVAAQIPHNTFSILLSHTPEIFRQAAHARFDVLLAGHTHGGQICLPGGFPITLDAALPRRLGKGAWRHNGMIGYTSAGCGTSMVDVRLNCPPEVTLHQLERDDRPG
ncbi:MAG: metallophosphoesterase [Alphaproteobacteria bacterium]